MNRERAKELLPVIQAFAEGKIIQFHRHAGNKNWTDIFDTSFPDEFEYRIKPEPREFWLIEHQDASISFRPADYPVPLGSIKVREVLDE